MAKSKQQRPNILLIMTDQQRYDSLGCYRCEAVNTPNLDRLAAEGVLFENCVVSNPICTPSRASVWTGKDLPGHGVLGWKGGYRAARQRSISLRISSANRLETSRLQWTLSLEPFRTVCSCLAAIE